MKQPIEILKTQIEGNPSVVGLNSTLESCGYDYLQILDEIKSPNIIINSTFEASEIALSIVDTSDNEIILIEDINFTVVNTELGYQYFINQVDIIGLAEGVYSFVFFLEGDTETEYHISDTYKFQDVSCLDYLEYGNECSLNKVYYNRVENFTHKIYFNTDSGYQNPTYELEGTLEEDDNGNTTATSRAYKKVETYTFFKTTEYLVDVIGEATIYNNFDLIVNSVSTNGEIVSRSVEGVNFNNCCVFNGSISFDRGQLTNKGCCSNAVLPDCIDYKTSSLIVDESIEENDYPSANVTKVYLILESTPSNGTPFSEHVGSVASFDGSQWNYEPVDYVESVFGWVNNLFEFINKISTVVQTSSGSANVDINVLNLTENYVVCMYLSIDGGGEFLLAEYLYSDFNVVGNIATVNQTLLSPVLVTKAYDFDFRLEAKLSGCMSTETTFSTTLNLVSTG